MAEGCYLIHDDHTPQRAAYPVIDAHNHLWGSWDLDDVVEAMDQVGVISYCDVTANARFEMSGGGYKLSPVEYTDFIHGCLEKYPGKFYGFTMAGFAAPYTEPLFDDPKRFTEDCVKQLRDHVALGARGLKLLKDLGLRHHDAAGNLVRIDDEHFAPIWETARELGVPVLIHQSDPCGFFQPTTPENEHYETLKKYPDWSFAGPEFPAKVEVLAARDRLLKNHPDVTFILAHVANYTEDLAYVSQLLDAHPNVNIDFSARMDELGRQPYSAREFMIRYQDRIIFGSDMTASPAMYRTYFRFLETYDEYFFPPDYDGTFDRHRWAIYGLGLPDEVLKKIYYANALKLVPGLKEDLKDKLPAD